MEVVTTSDKAWAPSSSTLRGKFFEVTTSDKAWAPSSSTLRSKFFEDVNNDILKENEEENAINDEGL
ncbi:hypothetical protein Gotur_006928 [Gossypium turneri]